MALANHDNTPETCDVVGCDKPAERSLNKKQIDRADFELKDPAARQIHLCKEHYKSYKKSTKTDRELDQVY